MARVVVVAVALTRLCHAASQTSNAARIRNRVSKIGFVRTACHIRRASRSPASQSASVAEPRSNLRIKISGTIFPYYGANATSVPASHHVVALVYDTNRQG